MMYLNQDWEYEASLEEHLAYARRKAAQEAAAREKLRTAAWKAATPWPEGIGPATAAAVGLALDELRALEAGQLAPAVAVGQGRPFGDIGDLSGAVLMDVTGLASKVGDELRRASEFIKLVNMPELLTALRLVDAPAADKLRDCADPECGFVKFCPAGDFAQYCNKRCWLRICPNCAKAIAQRLRDKLEAVLVEVQKARVPGFTLKHLTLTMKRTLAEIEGLSPEAALMAKAYAEQRDIEDIHDMTKALERSLFLAGDKRAGASAYLENGPEGGNVHNHVVQYSGFVLQAVISDTWRELSLKYRPMWRPWVNATLARLSARKAAHREELKSLGHSRSLRARRLRLVVARMSKRWMWAELVRQAKRQGIGDSIVFIRKISAEEAVAEVVKYVTKLLKRDDKTGKYETSVSDLVAIHLALKGKRRAWSWGSFYGVDIVEPEAETEPNTCPVCGGTLLGGTVPEVRRLLLHSKDANNCRPLSHPGAFGMPAPMAAGP